MFEVMAEGDGEEKIEDVGADGGRFFRWRLVQRRGGSS